MAGSFHARRDLMAIGLLVVGAIIGGFLSVRPPAMPSDTDLRQRFDEHRAAFDSLATLSAADTQLVRLRPRLRPLGVSSMSRERDGETIWFVVRTHDGSRKGYVYSRRPLQPVLDSLDPANQNGYVSLAPGWFLFLQSAD